MSRVCVMVRGGQKNKIKRIAHIKWLLFAQSTPPAWTTAQKLYNELEFLKQTLQNRVPQVTTHSAHQIKVINQKVLTKPNIPKPLPKRPEVCPTDCQLCGMQFRMHEAEDLCEDRHRSRLSP